MLLLYCQALRVFLVGYKPQRRRLADPDGAIDQT